MGIHSNRLNAVVGEDRTSGKKENNVYEIHAMAARIAMVARIARCETMCMYVVQRILI